MTVSENEQKRYELLEYIDYLAQINKEVRLEAKPPGIKDVDPILVGIWLKDLEERKLISSLRGYKSPGRKPEEDNFKADWFTFKASDGFNDYVDKVYRYLHLSIENLSQSNFLAVLDAAYDIRKKLEVTQANQILINNASDNKRFPQLVGNLVELRADALNFLKEYGAIKEHSTAPDAEGTPLRISVTLTRRLFDRTYQTILTRAVQDGFATYKNDPIATSAIAKESKRRQQMANKPEDRPIEKPSNSPQEPTNHQVFFNSKSSTLSCGKLTCDIPDETLEYYVCKLAFKNRQRAVREVDILEAFTKSQENKRPVYDAMLRINRKSKTSLGLNKRLLICKAAKIRINKIYQ